MDTRYTNKERFLDGLSNNELAYMIWSCTDSCNDCPIIKEPEDIEKCIESSPSCCEKISKWLGEYAND